MNINLLRDYCGRIIQDRVLLAGVQEVENHVGDYLIGKGYAVAIDPQPVSVSLDDLQAQSAITVTHDDSGLSTVALADDADDFDPDAPSALYVNDESEAAPQPQATKKRK